MNAPQTRPTPRVPTPTPDARSISVVVPLFNEAESLPELVEAITRAVEPLNRTYEILLVDDGSTDDSHAVAQRLHERSPGVVRVFRLSRNFGKSAALSVGIENAVGDVVVTMDADLQDDPAAIPQLLDKLGEGWDLVSGWKKKRFDPLSKTIPSKLFNVVTSWVSGVRLHDFNCGLKAYRADVAKSLKIYGERHRFLPALAHWDNYRVTEIPVTHHPRKYGRSKFGPSRFVHGLFDLVTLLFLKRYVKNPLHFFGMFGLLFGLVGSIVLSYFGVQWFVTRELHVRPLMLFAVGAIIMGIQFISLGLLGEMITNATPPTSYRLRSRLDRASDE
jgi:glycosyltransferase involved in cell wall biosynthesis